MFDIHGLRKVQYEFPTDMGAITDRMLPVNENTLSIKSGIPKELTCTPFAKN
jgi:hypothetical protein